jgi:penicillin-binding protein 1A
VKDSLGNTVVDNSYPEETEVVSAGTAYVITTMLEDVINHGTGYPNAIIGRPAAGKTGTTSDFRDAWFVGFTPDLVAAVWIGNDDYHPMNESYGGDVPARIWARFMKGALQNVAKHDFVFPGDEVKKMASCGRGYGPYEYYLAGTEPTTPCGAAHVPKQVGAFGQPIRQSDASASMPPAPTFSPEPSAPPVVTTPAPDAADNAQNYIPYDSPSPAATTLRPAQGRLRRR